MHTEFEILIRRGRWGGTDGLKKRIDICSYGNHRESDEITGTSAWRQIHVTASSFHSVRDRVSQITGIADSPPTRQIDFRWTFGFPSVATVRGGLVLRCAMRAGVLSVVDCKPNNGCLKYTSLEIRLRSWKLKDRRNSIEQGLISIYIY